MTGATRRDASPPIRADGRSPLVFFSDISWHALYQRPQHIAAGAARHRPVLWVEPATLGHPVAWTPVRVLAQLHRITVPLFPHNARNRAIRTIADPLSRTAATRNLLETVQRRILVRAMDLLGMPSADTAVLLENFQLIRLARSINPSDIVFDYIDDAFGFTAMPEYVRDLWHETVATASAVTVTATRLREQVAALRSGPVHVVRNGVEYERFAAPTAPRPADLPPAGTPIIGYVGSIYPWFDTAIIADAARRLPEAHLVLIGPTHPDIGPRLTALRNLPNVHLLGPRPYADLPAYVRHFQAGIIPFLRNTLTESVNPVKLYEYAAAGVPVVTTFFADDLEVFNNVIHISRDPGEFVQHVRAALAESGNSAITAGLRRFARENDWSVRVEAILGLLGHGGR